MNYFFTFILVSISVFTYSQPQIFNRLSEKKEGWGIVTLKQDARIEALVSKHIEINKKAKGFPGYRIQVYFGSGTDAKNTANKIRNKINNEYTEYESYLIYETPYFKVRVGDFRNKNEAYKAFKTIKNKYPQAFITDDLIQLPPLN